LTPTAGQNSHELITLPTPQMVGGPKRALQGVSHDAKNGAYRSLSVGRLEERQLFWLNQECTEGNGVRSEERDLLAQVRHHQCLVGKFRALVLTTILGQII